MKKKTTHTQFERELTVGQRLCPANLRPFIYFIQTVPVHKDGAIYRKSHIAEGFMSSPIQTSLLIKKIVNIIR